MTPTRAGEVPYPKDQRLDSVALGYSSKNAFGDVL